MIKSHHFKFGPFFINEVLTYKYLGIELDYKLSFQEFKSKSITKARSNIGRISAMGIRSGFLSVSASLNLWEALVRSNLEYGSELWGFDKWPQGEQVQITMAKRILRCFTKATNEAVLGDLGLWSRQGRRNLKKLIYWRKILFLPDSKLVKQAYLFSKSSNKKSNWANGIKNYYLNIN